jgi:hypothetical protein
MGGITHTLMNKLSKIFLSPHGSDILKTYMKLVTKIH